MVCVGSGVHRSLAYIRLDCVGPKAVHRALQPEAGDVEQLQPDVEILRIEVQHHLMEVSKHLQRAGVKRSDK